MSGRPDTIPATPQERTPPSHEAELAVLRARVARLEQESAERIWMDDALKALAFGTASATGQEFLQVLVRQLSATLKVRYVFVTEWVPGRTDRLRTVAGWCGDRTADPIEYELCDSPCRKVLQDGTTFIPRGVRQLLPQDEYLATLNIESYMGVPLLNRAGRPTGHLCVMDVRPFLFDDSQGGAVIRAFAERAAAELERLRAGETLRQSEERFRTLYDDNPSMYFTLSPGGTVLSVNRFGAAQLGYTSNELVGRSVLDVFDPLDHQTVLKQLVQCTRNPHKTFEWELQKVRQDRTRLWVRERARAVPDAEGALTILVVCEDVTEHRKTTQLLSTLVRESPLPIVSLDPDARVTSWNQAATRLFGWTEQEVLGRELPYVPQGQERTADALWEQGTRGKVTGPIELRRQRKDGTMLDLLLWPVFVYNESGQLSTAVGLYVDQSDLKRAETARLKSEARLRAFLDALDDLAFEFDEQGIYLNVWTHNEEALLLPKQDIVGKRLSDIYGTDEAARFLACIGQVLTTGQSRSVEYAGPIRGQLRHFSAVLSRIPTIGDSQPTVACVVRDITERKRAEAALQMSEQHLKSIIETSPECIKLVAADGTLLQMNAAGLAMIEAERAEEVIGQSVYPLVSPRHREAFRMMNERVCLGHKEFLEFEVVGLRGIHRWMETHAVPLYNPADGAVVQLAITRDVTERKQTEEALRRQERTLQRARDERERICQDLHDNILQALYAVGMQLEAGKLSFSKAPRKSKSHTTQAIDQLNRLVVDVRRFIALLKQPTASSMDFGRALRQLVANFSAGGQAAPELDINDLVVAMVTTEQAEQLLNIAREALSNSMRHAQAAHRCVRLSRFDHTVRMQICDDGVGFDPKRKRTRGHGLANMAARAKRIRARFSLESRPGKGTRITIELPTEEQP